MIIRYINRKMLDDGSSAPVDYATVEPGEPMWPGAAFKPVLTIVSTIGNLNELTLADPYRTAIERGSDGHDYLVARCRLTDRILAFMRADLQVTIGDAGDPE